MVEAKARVDGSWEAEDEEEEEVVEEVEAKSEEELEVQEAGDETVRQKRSRCRECVGCLASDCGECKFCLDKAKFGGPDKLRQSCVQRKCVMLRERPEGSAPAPKPTRSFAARSR